MGEEDYSVERQLLETRVFPTEQGRLDPAPHTPASVVDPGEVYRRWRSSQGSGLDDAQVEVVFGLFTDEVQGPYGGPSGRYGRATASRSLVVGVVVRVLPR